MWAEVRTAGPITPDQRLRLARARASAYAMALAAQVVEAVWYAAGASSIFIGNPLERRFRDVHAMAQRANFPAYSDAGQMFLRLGGSLA